MKKAKKYQVKKQFSLLLLTTMVFNLFAFGGGLNVLAANTVVAVDDFSTYTLGTKFDIAGVYTLGNWNFTLLEGDSAEIAIDPTTNSKALKITKGLTYGDMHFDYNFPKVENCNAKISYSTRFETHSRHITHWGSSYLDDNRVNQIYNYDKGLYVGMSTLWTTNIGYNLSNFDIVQTFDFIAGKTTVALYNKGSSTPMNYTVSNDTLINGVNKLLFNIKNENPVDPVGNINPYYSHQVKDSIGNVITDNGVYWLDDIVIDKLVYPQVKAVAPQSGATSVLTDEDITIGFNTNVLSSSVNYDNIKLYENNQLVPNSKYTLNMISGNNVCVSLVNGMQPNSTYRIQTSNIKSAGQMQLQMQNISDVSFTTAQKTNAISSEITDLLGNYITSISQFPGSSIKLSVNIQNSTSTYCLIGAIIDENSNLLSLTKTQKTLLSSQNSLVSVELLVPENTTSSAKVEFFVWESLQSLKPLCNKGEIL